MDCPYLSDDILLHVISFADKQTVQNLMQTSWMFHHYGARYILEGHVLLNTSLSHHILSFTRFMLGDRRDSRYRLPFLRDFTLLRRRSGFDDAFDTSIAAGSALQCLFTMIAEAGKLVRLVICDTEEILSMHPALPEAVAKVRTLRDLQVDLVGELGARMLSALRAPALERAVIGMFPVEGEEGEEENAPAPKLERDPTRLLRHSHASLLELSVSYADLDAGSACFPRVVVLGLERIRPEDVEHYARAFPHVRDLWMEEYCAWNEEDMGELHVQRARNLAVQRRSGSWPSLESFDGPIGQLYLLGLPCPIRSLNLNNHDEIWNTVPGVLDAVLECARPRFLKLDLMAVCWFDTLRFPKTFARPECVGALKALEFELHLMWSDIQLDLPACFDRVIPSVVAPLKYLTMFTLRVDCSDVSTSLEEDLPPVKNALKEWDMTAFAHRVRKANSTLSSVRVSLEAHGVRPDESVHVGRVIDH
ncbi:hypothetical protein BD413DRAFT_680347 [Trametes elegans]|nr:hypothetical protein BD413DRAFT_680347 [Trametes elegans]